MSWPASRAAGLVRLEDWIPRSGRSYQSRRNFDLGPTARDNVSGLSPYLRHRLLTEPEVLEAVLSAHSPSAADKFLQEVFWRTYWKGWLEHHPQAWRRYRSDLDALLEGPATDEGWQAGYDRAVAGESGIAPFDGWVAELVESGYLHNHARMWFASIWVHTLKLPWVLGADFFLRHLLDGDPASNTLSWRWVVGLHTAGKTYLARPDNIARYTDGRFADTPGLAAKAEALQEPPVAHEGLSLPDAAVPIGGRLGLLLTDEDLSLPVLGTNLVSVKGVSLAERRSPRGASARVTAFAAGAIADALGRSRDQYGCTVDEGIADGKAGAVLGWAQLEHIDSVLMSYPTVGPARDFHDELAASLRSAGVAVELLISDYDRLCWPHADRGYFKLRKRIPELLAELGIMKA